MNRTILGIRWVCAVALGVAVSAPAAAQDQPTGGPFTGLFKGSPKEQPQKLDVTGSAFGSWDDNLFASAPGSGVGNSFLTDPRYLKAGVANGFQGAIDYGFSRSGTRSHVSIGAGAAVQEYASALNSDPIWFHSYNGSANFRTDITPKISALLNGGAAYAPYYQYAPFLAGTASEESPVGSDYGFAVNSSWIRSVAASAGLEDRITKRSSLSASVGWEDRAIPANEAASIETRTARVMFSHNLTRKLAFHLGYSILETQYATSDAEPLRTNMLEVGLGYGDGLTFRFGRTTLNMTIGASIAKNGDPVSVATTGQSTQFVLNGSATLSRPLGRTWSTSLGYTRGTSYMVGFREPVVTDAANAGIGGPLATRLQFSAGVGASRGQQLFTASGGNIVSYTASARLNYAVFTHLGLFAQASYYRFTIPEDFTTTFDFVPGLNRRSVMFGLNTWLPLIKAPRVRRDPGTDPTTGQL